MTHQLSDEGGVMPTTGVFGCMDRRLRISRFVHFALWKRWRRYGDPLLGRKSPIVCLPEHVMGVEVDEPDVSGFRTGG